MKKWNKSHQKALSMIFLGDFCRHSIKTWKSWLNFLNFQSMSIRVACVQTPPPLRKNNNCVRVVQESRVVLVFQLLFSCQRENKNNNNLCKCIPEHDLRRTFTDVTLPDFFRGVGGRLYTGYLRAWFVARQVWFVGGKMRDIAIRLVLHQCCKTRCTSLVAYLEVHWSP